MPVAAHEGMLAGSPATALAIRSLSSKITVLQGLTEHHRPLLCRSPLEKSTYSHSHEAVVLAVIVRESA